MKPAIRRLFITSLMVCMASYYPFGGLKSQVVATPSFPDDLIEQIFIDEEEEERSVESYVEELAELHQCPINLNATTRHQLELFPFLSDIQVENLLFYLYTRGPMKTIYELRLVEEMDYQTIQYLLPFVYVADVKEKHSYPSLRQIGKYGKYELTARLDIPLYTKAGYRDYPDSILSANPNKEYLGSPYYHSLRYAFRYRNQIYWGLTAEKDAGEPFFSQGNKRGYDYYSFYFYLRDMGHLKALAIGNYRLSYGLGLVMNTDFGLGKSSTISTIGYKAGGIRKHSSTDEYNYFRGIAAAYQVNSFTFSAFYSHRHIDAIVNNRLITSVKKDGLHRVPRDFERRDNASLQVLGGNIAYQSPRFRCGLTAVYNFFNYPFKPEVKPYSALYPTGRRFYNIGADYRYRWRRFTFYGETAVGKGGGVATLNVLRFSPLSGYQVLLLQRYYSPDYYAMYGRSVSENSELRNENGWYLGIESAPFRYWKLTAYADFFRFPWLKYGVDRPSEGFDGLLQATFTPRPGLSMFLRYRYKEKGKNYRDEATGIQTVRPYLQHKWRYQLNYSPRQDISFRTLVDFVSVHPRHVSSGKGFLLMQAFSYSFRRLPARVDVNYGVFDTDDYASRVSFYEKGLLYAFSVPSFYGKGIRAALNVKYDFGKRLTAHIKIGHTKYADRSEIGSGLELIEGNRKTDVQGLVRWKW